VGISFDENLRSIQFVFLLASCGLCTAGSLSKLLCVSTSLEEDGEILKREFNSYLGRLFEAISERREQDEMNILGNRW
jgi:hypothetical protein